MNTLKSNILWAAVCLVMFGVIWVYDGLYQKAKKEAVAYESTISNLNQEIAQGQIQLNESIMVYQSEVKNLQVSKDNVEAHYKDLLKAAKLRPKDVNSVGEITTQAHSVDTVIAKVDTFGGLRARLADKWANIEVEVKKNRQTIIDYTFRDSLTVISVQKKHSILFGLIKWKSLESTRVINHNPKAKVTGLQMMEVLQ